MALLGVAVLATAMATGQAYRTEGPLVRQSVIHIDFPLRDGEVGTWGVSLPANPTLSEIVIESVEPVGVKALDVIGVAVITPGPRGGIGTAYGFPPEDFVPRPPEGAVLPAAAGGYLDAIIGVARADPSADGTIDALRVRYRHDGARYKLMIHESLRVFEPSSDGSSSGGDNIDPGG